MAFIKNRYDKQAQEDGKWFEYDGGKFLLASARSTAFLKAYAEVNQEDIDEDKVADAICKIFKGWEDVMDEDGVTPLECSEDNVKEILLGDPDFGQWVLATVVDQDNYKREIIKAKTKK